ncbi:MAG: type ISP restriction/modification enzyme, partial [Anaerolineae bacterium]|nr:type ISP restriction/modification enzyme [Anaerolineae bacterium]
AGNRGMWQSYVQKNLLKRLFGFELLMAPYTVAHMKLNLLLCELGYNFESDDRLGIYLTNTLEENVQQATLPFAEYLTDEANAATLVKREKPIMVVLGNPPYSGHSANRSRDDKGKFTWIGRLLNEYYFVDGQPLGERNPRWLQDDYVKFIRFGQWRIEQTGSGVLAFVTNHGYLDNVTFRGMRQQLMQTFTDIYILDLHGNSRKREKSPDGSPDENVFDIVQGVSIALFVKEAHKTEQAKVHHLDVYGKRRNKYEWLVNHDMGNTDWTTIEPQKPFYLFTPLNTYLIGENNKGRRVPDMLQTHSIGIVTARDHFLIRWTPDNVEKTMREFLKLPVEKAREKFKLRQDVRDWQVQLAQNDIVNSGGFSIEKIVPVYYRPFDIRHSYFTGNSRGIMSMPRNEVMQHLLPQRDNLAFITSRLTKGETFKHVQVTNHIVETICMSPKTSNNGYVFPLYLYPKKREGEMFAVEDDGSAWQLSHKGRRPNLNPDFIKAMESKLGLRFVPEKPKPTPASLRLASPPQSIEEGESDAALKSPLAASGGDLEGGSVFYPEDVFHYAYAVFHSPTYRERYAEFLKIDFPRLPLTSNVDLFRTLCEKGEELVKWHLMTKKDRGAVTYPESGDNEVLARGGYPKYKLDKATDATSHIPTSNSVGKASMPSADTTAETPSATKGKVFINRTQYFGNVAQEVWEFHIGGYQVLHKWLKDRRGRTLDYNDILHYEQIVTALENTMRLMDEIDAAIPSFPLL